MKNASNLDRIRKAFDYLVRNGFPDKGDVNVLSRAIWAAHGALPSTHWDAQRKAQEFLDAEGIKKELKGTSPCIVLGFRGPYKYFIEKGYINRSYCQFRPTCVEHLAEYDKCRDKNCVYGVKLNEEWVHKLL